MPESWKPYAKTVAALATVALEAVQHAIPMSPVARAWVTVGIAVAGSVAVWAVPNKPAQPNV